MKILIVFMDMLRTDFLNVYDENLKETPLDNHFKKMKGTLFDNIYTPCPDTARSLSTFFSGRPCYENNCNKRGKYPGQFLKIPTFLDALEENEYSIHFFTNRSHLIFPQKFQDDSYFLDTLDGLHFADKSLTFVDIPDMHHVIDDYGPTKKGVRIANKQLTSSIDYLYQKVNPNIFDIIYYFSDHGHMNNTERVLDFDDEQFLSSARSRIFYYEKNKNDNEFKINKSFSSIAYFPAHIIKSLNIETKYDFGKYDFHNPDKNLQILIEDFKSINSGINQVPDLWGIKTNNNLITFNKHTINNVNPNIINTWAHLKELQNEYFVFDEYLKFTNKKKNEYKSSSNYFDGKERHKSNFSFLLSTTNNILKRYLPTKIYIYLRKFVNKFLL